jgi:uncharacterized protein (TIGR02611 family)
VIRRAAIVVGGFALLAVGLALLVLPGPGIPVLVAGLGLLSLEFEWARRLRVEVLRRAERVAPRRRSHRIAVGGLAVASMVAGLVAGALWLY